MGSERLELFSDGVLAIIIIIMVLELKVPHGDGPRALVPLVPVFLSYVLSFIFIGIYWSNHHHLLYTARHVNGRIMWANLHLLFWLSLIPFVTGWMGENQFAALPVALYGTVLLAAAVAYFILARALVSSNSVDPAVAKALGKDFKGKSSVVCYAAAVPLSFVNPWLACALYVVVAVMWLIPDRRIERALSESAG